ncbi:MAG TPA: zinc-dependent alcohol dehydrogenase family protein [Polyangiaceae bacterium]|nr:zinc-dependent alcohol dehydrogenase family protein [Polyangiaceae bacterium]
MRAMVLEAPRELLLEKRVQTPRLGYGQLLIRVRACGVCRTDLHVCDGELAQAKRPLILGHQIVGTVAVIGDGVDGFTEGQRVGIPWLGRACGDCRYCMTERENLCDRAEFTGYQIDGGYAEYTVANPRFALPLPGSFSDLQAAPLLCAGLIGYRALSLTFDAERVGLYGFGSAAHIVAQVAAYQGRRVFAFTRPGDVKNQEFAKKLGAAWAGGSDQSPPETLDAAIIFAPAGPLVPRALRAVGKGGNVVCAGIHMSDIPSFPYELLWGERTLRSVANLTRRDGLEFLELAPRIPIHTEVQSYSLSDANRALEHLRNGALSGALVLTI